MDLPSAVSNVDSTLTRVTQTPSEIRSDRLLVAYSSCPNFVLGRLKKKKKKKKKKKMEKIAAFPFSVYSSSDVF